MNLFLILIYISLNLLAICLSKHQIALKEDATDLTAYCVNHIVETIYKPKDLIILSGVVTGFQVPVINYDRTKSFKQFKVIKMDIAIIHLKKKKEFNQIIKKMSKEQFFNPSAKFMVITPQLSQKLLEVASKFYLKNIIFIQTLNYSIQLIYTYKPYKHQNSSFIPKNYKYLTQCENGNLITSNLFGNYRVPKTWKNSTINVIHNVIPPYFQCPTCESSIEAHLLNIVSEKLGFKVNYVQQKEFRYWGSKINGSYGYILEKLFQRKCDMVLGAFHSKFDEHLDFDKTFTFMRDGLFWLVPTAPRLSSWRKLAFVLNFKTYSILLSTIIVVSVVCRLLYKKSTLHYFLELYQTILEAALPRLPRHRIIYAHVVITFLTISTVFKGSLIHLLSLRFYDHQVSTLEDIVNSNLSIYIDHDIAQYFKNDNPLDRYVYQNYKFCNVPRNCINRTAFQRDVVTIDFQRAYDFNLPIFYVDSEGKPLLYLFPDPFFPLYIHWYFVKGFPILPQINDVMLKLKSTGIVHYWCDRISFKAKVDLGRKTEIASNILKLNEVGTLFALLIFGLSLSLIVFFLELGIAFVKRKVKTGYVNVQIAC